MEADTLFPRTAHRGRTYVYLLPCRDADVAKLGYSRDPLGRLRTLHPRFFELFDLERGMLLETGRLADARAVERMLHRRFAADRVPAPLRAREAAAGRFEWFCGVSDGAAALLREQADASDWIVHAPLRDWLHDRLAHSTGWLYAASARLLEADRDMRLHAIPPAARPSPAGTALARVLDTFEALGFALDTVVPPDVLHWQRERCALHFDRQPPA